MAREALRSDAWRAVPREWFGDPQVSPNGELVGVVVGVDERVHLEVETFAPADAAADDADVTVRQVLADRPMLRAPYGSADGTWCWTVASLGVVYLAEDGNLWHQRLGGTPARRLTAHGPDRMAAAPVCTLDGRAVVYVVDQAEVWRVTLRGGIPTRLDAGTADFVADPWVAADGSVGWVAWDAPDMPWDRSRLVVRGRDGTTQEVRPPGSVQQVHVTSAGRTVSVRDDDGWAQVWVDEAPLLGDRFEHAAPLWGPRQRTVAVAPNGQQVAFARNEDGFGRLCVADVSVPVVREIARGVHEHLSWRGHRLVAIRSGARTPPQLVQYDTTTWQRTATRHLDGEAWPAEALVEPELLQVASSDATLGGHVHARLYRATGDGIDESHRLMVLLHGGPTDQWPVSFLPRVAFWCRQGWNVVVPDHRGSSGHGRAYQQALNGRWGELDVADVVDVLDCLATKGVSRPEHTVVFGSSSGGFTALGVLAAAPELVAAVVALSPVTDLLDMAARTHRFERHYTERLVGPLPEAEERYRERSPILHAQRFTARPILLLHGADDAVVPVDRTLVFAERVRTAGGTVEVHVYPGEGHGVRRREHRVDEYLRAHAFLERHLPVGSGG